jgi:hypothetical protein
MSEYYASRRRRYVHPKTMEQYRREWRSMVAEHERNAQWAFERLENAIEEYKADPFLGRLHTISGEAATLKRERFEADKYQRLIDGRPTLAEERDARCRDFEARMDAEYRREVSGGWADDEFNARYDDVRERFHSSINEQ